jgi:hypothetical protein
MNKAAIQNTLFSFLIESDNTDSHHFVCQKIEFLNADQKIMQRNNFNQKLLFTNNVRRNPLQNTFRIERRYAFSC